ncbi:MAG: SDR family NAD(P)-dependent oxidoreductase [Intrasporangium sp.]|uniref:SDR family oxidoreductase n=1 Tax=Intrasporangium sp. TaxID=1925024 RepID=UPI0026491055|nr:SDR family NAD(P)-dependent oxidoreductase [Intrasporangium sp.]MDN5794365.1 SDR family NAD(P)-dependent oxidoreductase [Intrasporangium sp.]
MTAPATVAWIVGATSGVGRASALALAGPDRHLVLSGRRESLLGQLADEVTGQGGDATVLALDATDGAAVDAAAMRISAERGDVGELLFSAGLNVRDRSWADLKMGEFDAIVDTNLNAVARAISLVLPGMRSRGAGRVVVISSWAGWTYGRGAGVAYSASKTALKALTESLNDQEGPHGISACLLCPGDIDTPLIDNRPVVPDQAQRERMLTPDDVARAVAFVFGLPRHACVNELVISPIESPSYGR